MRVLVVSYPSPRCKGGSALSVKKSTRLLPQAVIAKQRRVGHIVPEDSVTTSLNDIRMHDKHKCPGASLFCTCGPWHCFIIQLRNHQDAAFLAGVPTPEFGIWAHCPWCGQMLLWTKGEKTA